MAGWKIGASMNPMPSRSIMAVTASGAGLMFTPSSESTLALPHFELTA